MSEIPLIEIRWPEYHSSAMGCGLEDRGIRDRYNAMFHGWECAVERCMEAVPDEPMMLASDVAGVIATKDAEISRLTAENADLRSGEYLARVVEERDRMRDQLARIEDADEGLFPDAEKFRKWVRAIARAALSPSSTTGEAE